MTKPETRNQIPVRFLVTGFWSLTLFLGVCRVGTCAHAAETLPTQGMRKTQLVIKLATNDLITVQARFEKNPPTIVVQFPNRRVAGTFPERSVIQHGAIQAIQTSYTTPTRPGEPRWVQALRIQLRGPYGYSVRSEPGRIAIDIEHPASVATETMEVGLINGMVVAGPTPPAITERFRAIQDALMRANPKPRSWSATFTSDPSPPVQAPSAFQTSASPLSTPSRPPATFMARHADTAAISEGERPSRINWVWPIAGLILAGGLMLAGGLGLWSWARQPQERHAFPEESNRASAGMRIIDQLVWRAFERQGYQLLQIAELGEPPGLLRIIIKDGLKAALSCVGDGVFFEKATVERFIHSMQQAQVEQGFLVAPGSFTVPAQRHAKEHGITLVGRDQLTELLSAGAISEYVTNQLQQLHKQLDEAAETLTQYAQQLDLFRRQRNEASWFLGEERAKTAKLEAQLADTTQQLRHWQAQAEQWQQTAEQTHRQWEESQWYLGEARASLRHLEEQLQTFQEASSQLDERARDAITKLQGIEQQRDEANWYLGESRTAQDALRQHVQQLEGQLTGRHRELEELRRSAEQLQQELATERAKSQALEAAAAAVRAAAERRRAIRIRHPAPAVELRDTDGTVLFQGSPRDISRRGIGLNLAAPADFPVAVTIRLTLPGLGQIVEAMGRLVWQQHDPATLHSSAGYELVEISPEAQAAVEQALAALN